MNTPDLPTVALIAGPTASGKSALAMALADLTPSVIINADSMQVYRDLRIVTARPSVEEEAQHPHRLFGYIGATETYSAARWAADAKAAIAEAHAEDNLPILVGGTGLYIRTLLDGIAPIPDIDPEIRASIRSMPVSWARIALSQEDPAAAARIAAPDTARTARALEVIRSTGVPLSEWQTRRSGGIGAHVHTCPLVLLPPRDWLMERCDSRFELMFEHGQLEVRTLAAFRLDPTLSIMRAIGVREISDYLAGRASLADARQAGRWATRQYAKRQYTWFNRQTSLRWPRLHEPLYNDQIANEAIMLRDRALTV